MTFTIAISVTGSWKKHVSKSFNFCTIKLIKIWIEWTQQWTIYCIVQMYLFSRSVHLPKHYITQPTPTKTRERSYFSCNNDGICGTQSDTLALLRPCE